jgi:hypothetical protein
MMADLLYDGDDDIFVYMGGDQEVPRDVKRAKIDESVDAVLARAFADCEQLIELEGHDKLKKIEADAFNNCRRLRRLMKMNGVIEIEREAFSNCHALSDLEFDKLEIVGLRAFCFCKSLRSMNMQSVRKIRGSAFHCCEALTDPVFGKDLEMIGRSSFIGCTALRRIAIPLKDGLIGVWDGAFHWCENLSRVDIVGGVHETISSLHMKSWRDTMKEEIDQINQTLLDTPPSEKPAAIQQWIESVIDRMEHYKSEHKVLVKEAMTLLELALWKANLHENDGNESELTMVQRKRARQERRITSGASIVIKNVLPFLQVVDTTT